jgi:hypothetical protein
LLITQVAPEQNDHDEDGDFGQGACPDHQHAVAKGAGGQSLGHGADSS